MLHKWTRMALPAMALAMAAPALADSVSVIDGNCISVAAPSGCLFRGNANLNTTPETQAAYNLYNDSHPSAQPDITLKFLYETAVPFPGTVTFDNQAQTSGTWSLPGYLVDFLAVKAADHFVLYQLQSPASSGSWNTFDIPSNGGPFALSHLAFFGSAVPEPAGWAMLVAGFGLVGALARRRAQQGEHVLA